MKIAFLVGIEAKTVTNTFAQYKDFEKVLQSCKVIIMKSKVMYPSSR